MASCSSPVEATTPRLQTEPCSWEGVHLGGSPADQSLLPSQQAAGSDLWRGWTLQTTDDGRLFYHHVASGTSQWQMPRELHPVLGEWVQVGEEGARYWLNETLGVSAIKDPQHTTNVFQAALEGNIFFLQLYTEVGGFLDALDEKGRSALHYNCAGGSTQAVLYLLQNRAGVGVPDRGGSTPLHWACRYGHAPIVRVLLDAKACPDEQNTLGDTPMHEAAALGRGESLQWLVLARANPELKNREARTALEVSSRNDHKEAAALLRRHEAQWRGEVVPEREPLPQPQRRLAPAQLSDSSGSEDEPEPTMALLVVRAARPLLRGVQWLANRVVAGRADLGASSKLGDADERAGTRQPRGPNRNDADLSDSSSNASGDDGDAQPGAWRTRRRPMPAARSFVASSRGGPEP